MPLNKFFYNHYLPKISDEYNSLSVNEFIRGIYYLNGFEYGDCSQKRLEKIIKLGRNVISSKYNLLVGKWLEEKQKQPYRIARLIIPNPYLFEIYAKLCISGEKDFYMGKVIRHDYSLNKTFLKSRDKNILYEVISSSISDVFLSLAIDEIVVFEGMVVSKYENTECIAYPKLKKRCLYEEFFEREGIK